MQMDDALQLADWRRRTFELYRQVRAASDPPVAWKRWTQGRDELLKNHPQSPIAEVDRRTYDGARYHPYKPGLRAYGLVTGVEPKRFDIQTSDDGSLAFTRFGVVVFDLVGQTFQLELYWLEGYGGGIFLPFRDATSGSSTYGGGRYLLDTVKGADLGMEGEKLILDFNFAYNPSCSYDPRWSCPLSPPANTLDVEIEAGEKYD